ncbi:MAG: hypothetical protein QNK37_23985 [Acidobacteriota bacterium]|nr:hypothetical protein [Acidobacteriota bacterium]
MSTLEDRIDEFETKYLGKLRRWSALVSPEDLDEVVPFVEEMDQVSKAVTRDLADHPDLFRERWQPVLRNAMGLIPSVQGHLERIRSESGANLSLLGRGQRGLAGYRQALPGENYNRVDSSG